LLVGASSTIAMVAYYRHFGFRRPRLLNRDLIFMTGFAVSFGMFLFRRAGDFPDLRDSLPWALLTDIPAIIAVGVYVYFELFVIERGRDDERDRTYLGPETPERIDHT
jgi:hypothetical protein